jgi:uncharacterized Fe-S cluster-containing radical SAM superfamily protein
MTWQQEEIENTVLTEEELREAILEGKRRKWYLLRYEDYRREQEEKKAKPEKKDGL